jgi:hypothetical protein
MKLPRYTNDSNVGNVKSSRTLTTGTQSGGAIAEIGKIALNKATEYGARKNAHDAKMRRLDINTNKDLSSAMFFGKTSQFETSLDKRQDFLTPDNWAMDYEKMSLTAEKEFKAGLDEQTWKEYQPLFYQKMFEGRNAVAKKITNQKLKNAGHAFLEQNIAYKTSIENATSLFDMKAQFELYTELHLKKNLQTNMFDQEKFGAVKQETKDYTNNKYGMLQATNGEIIMSPNGSQEVDWNNVTSKLKDTNFKMYDLDDNELTVDDDIRQALIKQATESYNSQNSLHTSQKVKIDREVKTNFVSTLIGLESGNEEAMEKSKTFLNDLDASDLLPAQKLTYKNAYLQSLKNLKTGASTYDSVQGQQALTIATFMVGSGAMDTEEEREVLWDLMGKSLIKPDKAMQLFEKSISLTKGRNEFKKDLTARATSMLMKEIGAGEDVLQLLTSINTLPPAERLNAITNALSNGKMTQESYNAMNNMFRLLSEGERKGFTYENMLVNQRHPNYILNDLISSYKGTMNDARLQELQSKIAGIQGTTATDKTFYIMPAEYFAKKTPSNASMVMPQRLEGEGVLAYVKRAKNLIKRNDNLPSVITGESIETLDISDLFLQPDFE